ncbi:MAG: enoyl-CoA hydratase-related protein [Xanthobacteraceae bacterium]
MDVPQDIVLTAVDDRGVATITLNRPQKGNAYDRGMLARLATIIAELSAAADIRAIVFRGAGKHFCVGGDLDDPFVHTIAEEGRPQVLMPHLCLAIDACPKPTVALVHGACFGGGFAIASVCDVWLASEDSFYALPELRLGFGVGPYIPFFARAMGARQLRRYLVTAERFTGRDALAMGVAHTLYAPGEGDAALEAVLAELLQSAPGATAETKRELSAIADLTPSRARIDELQQSFHALYHTAEGAEGRAAFHDKRRPAWAPKD